MKRLILTIAMIVSASTAAAGAAGAQDLRFVRRTGGFGAIGFSGGNFTLECDSGCPGDQLSSSGANLVIGRHFSPRVRAELGAQYQSNRDAASNAFSGSVGAAVYLFGGLHVRGAATYLSVSVEDTLGTTEGSGGPGFLVGAGYDLHLGRTFALTPYVNYTSGSMSSLDRALGGGTSVTTAGDLTALNFGVSASFIRGTWECTTRTGEKVRVTRRNRDRATACLREVEARLGQRPSGIKY